MKPDTTSAAARTARQALFPTPILPAGLRFLLGIQMALAFARGHFQRRFPIWVLASSLYLGALIAWMISGLEWEAIRLLLTIPGAVGSELFPFLLEECAAFIPAFSLGVLMLAALLFLRSGPRWAMEPAP